MKEKLIHLVTKFDKRESKKKSYNFYALALYFQAVEYVVEEIENGATVESAIKKFFCDRLETFLLKEISKGK